MKAYNNQNEKQNYDQKIGNYNHPKKENLPSKNNNLNNNFNQQDLINGYICRKNIDNNYSTPGNDEYEIKKYYNEMRNEKIKNQNRINQSFLNQSLRTSINNELDLNPSFSLSQYSKVPNVILESDGKSTYMKSVLQCLANIKPIANYYLKEINTFKYHMKELPISYYFSRIIFHFFPYPENTLQKSFSLSTFQKIINYYDRRFDSISENNPKVFMDYFINLLHEEDKKYKNNFNLIENNEQNNNKKYKEYIQFLSKYEKSCIFENFCWLFQDKKKCLICNTEFIEYNKKFIYKLKFEEMLQNSQLNCNQKISIMDCIKYQTKKQNKKDNCKNCQKHNCFEIESLIHISPQYLILYLELNDTIINNFGKIEINKNLYLYDIVKDESSFNNYSLNGMIVHDLDSNKYFAYCCSPVLKNSENWYNYEEKSINKIKQEDLFRIYSYNTFPTILIYKAI